jgi:hypothetical protein
VLGLSRCQLKIRQIGAMLWGSDLVHLAHRVVFAVGSPFPLGTVAAVGVGGDRLCLWIDSGHMGSSYEQLLGVSGQGSYRATVLLDEFLLEPFSIEFEVEFPTILFDANASLFDARLGSRHRFLGSGITAKLSRLAIDQGEAIFPPSLVLTHRQSNVFHWSSF